ncbi:hypothetical protein C8250_036405 [Streptomyces sp. So13.3]|uniref:hypothetical protein n=1 Tax=Streptomyces TaxID=1883 RepID=UPI0011057D66|nr:MULTISPECIES: hypothetical protein [Streptomyces]MCZ4097372.1 hypothetical protein [Streptomyces sp. H39-C1]QNA76621.1 hypothetical protein C8250_036405 [Streptomyces sp. So13.3]
MTTLFSNPDPSMPVAAHTSPIPSTDPFQQADLGDEPDDLDEDEEEAAPPAPPAQARPRRTPRAAARR